MLPQARFGLGAEQIGLRSLCRARHRSFARRPSPRLCPGRADIWHVAVSRPDCEMTASIPKPRWTCAPLACRQTGSVRRCAGVSLNCRRPAAQRPLYRWTMADAVAFKPQWRWRSFVPAGLWPASSRRFASKNSARAICRCAPPFGCGSRRVGPCRVHRGRKGAVLKNQRRH